MPDDDLNRPPQDDVAVTEDQSTGTPTPSQAAVPRAEPGQYASFQLSAGVDLTQETRTLVDEYEAESERATDLTVKARLLVAAGRIWERQLSDPRRAQRCYRAARESVPDLAPAGWGLIRSMERLGQWEELVDQLIRLAEGASGALRIAYLLQLAMTLELRLNDRARAAESYQQILRESPNEVAAALPLVLICDEDASPQERETAYARLSAGLVEPTWLAVLSYWQALAAIEAEAPHDRVVGFLKEAIAIDPRTPRVWTLLRHCYRTVGDHQALVTSLTDDPNLDLACRHYWAARVCFYALNDAGAACDHLAQALDADRDCTPALQLMTVVSERLGAFQEVQELLERLIELTPDRRARLELYHEAGLLQEKQGNEEAAIELYQQALALRPNYLRSLSRLGALYQRLQRWDDLLRMHRDEARHEPNRALQAISYRRMGEVLAQRLDRVDEAIDAYEKALERLRGDALSIRALEELYARRGRWQELLHLYETRVDQTADPAEQAALLECIAIIAAHRLEDNDVAVAALRRVPPDAPAGVSLLRLRAMLLEGASCWADLVDVLRREAELLTDSKRKASLLVWAAEILEYRLGQLDAAEASYRAATEMSPSFTAAWLGLSRLYRRQGQIDKILEAFVEQLPHTPRSEQPALHCRIAELLAVPMGQSREALDHFERAFEIDPTFLPAAHGLYKHALATHDVPRLLKAVRASADYAPDPRSRALFRFQHAELQWESVGDRVVAVDELIRLMREYSHLTLARELLAEAAQQGVRHDALVDLLEREAARADDDEQRVRLLLILGDYHWRVMNQPLEGARAFREVLTTDPTEPRALLAVLLLCEEHDDQAGAMHALARLTAATDDVALRRALLLRLAVMRENLGQPTEQVIVLLRDALDEAPGDHLVLNALQRLATVSGDRDLLIEVLMRELESAGANDADELLRVCLICDVADVLAASDREEAARSLLIPLIDDEQVDLPVLKIGKRILNGDDPDRMRRILELEAAQTNLPAVKAADLFALAEDTVDRLGDHAAAFRLFESALMVDAGHSAALDRLMSLFGEGGRSAELVPVLERILAQARAAPTPDFDGMAALCAGLVRALGDGDASLDRRLELLNEAVRYAPKRADLLLALGDTYEQSGLFTEAAAVYSRLVESDLDPQLAKEMHLRLAAIWGDQLEDTVRACDHLRVACELDPGDEVIRRRYKKRLREAKGG